MYMSMVYAHIGGPHTHICGTIFRFIGYVSRLYGVLGHLGFCAVSMVNKLTEKGGTRHSLPHEVSPEMEFMKVQFRWGFWG